MAGHDAEGLDGLDMCAAEGFEGEVLARALAVRDVRGVIAGVEGDAA